MCSDVACYRCYFCTDVRRFETGISEFVGLGSCGLEMSTDSNCAVLVVVLIVRKVIFKPTINERDVNHFKGE